jgi:hypothetical protein
MTGKTTDPPLYGTQVVRVTGLKHASEVVDKSIEGMQLHIGAEHFGNVIVQHSE